MYAAVQKKELKQDRRVASPTRPGMPVAAFIQEPLFKWYEEPLVAEFPALIEVPAAGDVLAAAAAVLTAPGGAVSVGAPFPEHMVLITVSILSHQYQTCEMRR